MVTTGEKLPAKLGASKVTINESKVREIGSAFRSLGFRSSDARASVREIGRHVPALVEKGPEAFEACVRNVRSAFGRPDGSLDSDARYTAGPSVDAYNAITPAAMGDLFVKAVLATLAGETLPALLPSRESRTGWRKGW